MSKKAQALIVILWLLVILTLLALTIGHRVSTALYLSRYQKDRISGIYLAKAGINWTIVELEKDKNSYDALNEPWADNEDIFKKIMLSENQNEFATISHNIIDKNNRLKTIYGVIDEERKININIASRELLLALLEEFAVNAAQDIVNNILIWRGDISDNDKIYEKLGYPCKADNFSNIEELTLVKDITPNDYQKLRESITTYGDGFVNINTVSFKTLTIFAHGIAKSLSIDENFADSVATKIIELRDRNGCFKEKNEIDIILTGEEEENIFNKLMDSIIFKSDNFLIEATGNVVKIRGKISAVYNRKDKRILYWHES